MPNKITLTEVDKQILNSYATMIDILGEYLGTGYEIVLHSLEDLDHAAIKVINGHYSGRKEGAPITNFALDILSKINKSGDLKEGSFYFNTSPSGAPIRSTTIPILGENNIIIGFLCMNFYMDMPLNQFFDSFFKNKSNMLNKEEIFSQNSDDLIRTSVEEIKSIVHSNINISTSNKNKEIIFLLNQREIFQLKNGVPTVAKYLGISVNTVYMHLRNLKK